MLCCCVRANTFFFFNENKKFSRAPAFPKRKEKFGGGRGGDECQEKISERNFPGQNGKWNDFQQSFLRKLKRFSMEPDSRSNMKLPEIINLLKFASSRSGRYPEV